MTRSQPAPINKVLPAIVGGPAIKPLQQSAEQSRITGILPEGKPGNESGELAVCNETRHEQIQNQRKRTKKISAAGRANKRSAASGAVSSYAFAAEDIRVSSKAGRAGKSRQVDADLQESKFKNRDPIPTRP